MRSIVNLKIEINHSQNLPLDGQSIADYVETALTLRFALDPLASARALLVGSAISYDPSAPTPCRFCANDIEQCHADMDCEARAWSNHYCFKHQKEVQPHD